MDKLSSEQYAALKKFLAIFSKRHFRIKGLPPEDEPVAVLEKMERTSPKQAGRALVTTVIDFVDSASHWPAEKVRVLDDELRSAGAPTLSELRRRYSRQYARVLKRGHIKSVEEYYMLKGVADDRTLAIDEAERHTLFLMLEAYEEQVTRQ